MSEEFKSGFVSMVGRTNVGKSSIINSLVKEKVAAIANKPQTTRIAIRGIVNRENLQIIFIDTPGIHKPKSKLGNTMVETAFGVVSDVDVVLFVIDASSKNIGKGDRIILDKIKQSGKKTILIINKIDLVKKEDIAKLIDLYKDEYNFESIIPVSVTKNINIEVIIDEIKKHLKPGPAYYDIDEYTDQTLRQLVEETIREKALRLLDDEVPHGIYVETEKMKESWNNEIKRKFEDYQEPAPEGLWEQIEARLDAEKDNQQKQHPQKVIKWYKPAATAVAAACAILLAVTQLFKTVPETTSLQMNADRNTASHSNPIKETVKEDLHKPLKETDSPTLLAQGAIKEPAKSESKQTNVPEEKAPNTSDVQENPKAENTTENNYKEEKEIL